MAGSPITGIGKLVKGGKVNRGDREEALQLAKRLLEEIEEADTPLDKLIFRASRLARLMGDETAAQWLEWERSQVPNTPDGLSWRYATARVFNDEDENVFIGAVRIVPLISTLEMELARLQLPSLSGDYALVTTNNILRAISISRNAIVKFQSVVGAVRGRLHSFVANSYYALRLSTGQDAMFETAKGGIDRVLSGLGERSLRQIESAYANLEAGDLESISAAMNSVRRLIDGFADAVFPATDEKRRDGQGNVISLGEQQRLNRIKAFIDDNAGGSTSRAGRLKRAIADVHGRVSTGVHNDVSAAEARYLFLSAYTLLGEILELPGRTNEPTTAVTVRE